MAASPFITWLVGKFDLAGLTQLEDAIGEAMMSGVTAAQQITSRSREGTSVTLSLGASTAERRAALAEIQAAKALLADATTGLPAHHFASTMDLSNSYVQA